MRKGLVVVFVGTMSVALVGLMGCKDSNAKMRMPWEKQSTTQMSEQDDCAMCPGVQHAKADGTCPKCGMKVK
jgi:uncharacterized paraquat-inducible protein A